jgi:hypothetical protein
MDFVGLPSAAPVEGLQKMRCTKGAQAMSRSPSALRRSVVRTCADATAVADWLKAQGRTGQAKAVMRLVANHIQAVKKLPPAQKQPD